MIQDIEPSRLDNHYTPKAPRAGDKVLLFDGGGRLMVRAEDGGIRFPAGRDVPAGDTVYLFSVDEDLYFCAPGLPVFGGRRPVLLRPGTRGGSTARV